MLMGYMRVSKADGSQTTDLQRDALLAAGVDAAHLYEDYASGKKDDRPGLTACLKALREGDTLYIWKLDRLGRDLRHLIFPRRLSSFPKREDNRSLCQPHGWHLKPFGILKH